MTINYLDKLFHNGPVVARAIVSEESLGYWLVGHSQGGQDYWRGCFDNRERALLYFNRNFDALGSLTPRLDTTGTVTDESGCVWEVIPDAEFDSERNRRLPQ